MLHRRRSMPSHLNASGYVKSSRLDAIRVHVVQNRLRRQRLFAGCWRCACDNSFPSWMHVWCSPVQMPSSVYYGDRHLQLWQSHLQNAVCWFGQSPQQSLLCKRNFFYAIVVEDNMLNVVSLFSRCCILSYFISSIYLLKLYWQKWRYVWW